MFKFVIFTCLIVIFCEIDCQEPGKIHLIFIDFVSKNIMNILKSLYFTIYKSLPSKKLFITLETDFIS